MLSFPIKVFSQCSYLISVQYIFLCWTFPPVQCTFDVILPPQEVQVLLGMDRELAYIRNGKVNHNAAAFSIPVSQDLDAIHLAWKLLPNSNRGSGTSMDSKTVTYRIFIETKSFQDNTRIGEDAMYQPSLNISHQGKLSENEEIIRISLTCNGRVHANVDINIRINFEIANEDQDSQNIELNLQRQKICTNSNSYDDLNGSRKRNLEWDNSGKPDTTFLAIIFSAFIIMIFTIIFIITINVKGCAFLFRLVINNQKTIGTTTTLSSNQNKNNGQVLASQTMESQFIHPTIGSHNEDITNPYEAIPSQPQPSIQENNVLTYNDAGLLTMDPRSGGGLPPIHLTDPPPPPPLPPPLPSNQQFGRNIVGARPGVFSGNKFEFVTAEFNSDAESRVTDWVNQHQKHQTQTEQETMNYNEENCQDLEDVDVYIRGEKIFESMQVERHNLKLGCLLQEGTFGRVYQGLFQSSKTKMRESQKTRGNANDTDENSENDASTNDDTTEDLTTEIDIIIKTVLSGSSQTQINLMVQEGVQLLMSSKTKYNSSHTSSKHILVPIATTWDGTSPMLIYQYPSHGNLKQYLTKFANAGLSTHQVVKMGVQLLAALGHLHKRGILHKDIATRNCFLNDGNTLQLADAALSRDLFPGDYHCLGDNENRPIKWMPVEAIQKSYSKASDVWSFGVFLWELMTKAQQPFSDVDPFEMESYLNEGYRLHQPMNCPDQLYSVLAACWGTRPHERASLQSLHTTLQSLQKQLQQFV